MTGGQNVFQGAQAIRDYLHPDNHPPLPLVEIPSALNPFAADGVRIFAKLLNFLPLMNVKSLPALSMLLQKETGGGLTAIQTIVENSSGNTVFSLAIMARAFGIPNTQAFVSNEVTKGKLDLLRFFGVDVTVNEEPICPDPSDENSGIYKARQKGQEPGYWNPGQYDNPANPEAHMRWTGPQIWQQTNGKVDVFCAGLGTTGTFVGAGSYLKEQNPDLVTVGVTRQPNNPVPGVRTPGLLREIAFDWKATADAIVEVGTTESFARSLKLCRHGLLVGPSSGFALAGLIEYLTGKKDDGSLDSLRDEDGNVTCVFVCPDCPFPYIDEYFEYLEPTAFPLVQNAHLLQFRPSEQEAARNASRHSAVEIDPLTACTNIYATSVKDTWNLLNANKTVPLKPDVRVIDIRDPLAFGHFHLPGSERMDFQHLLEGTQDPTEWTETKTFIVCAYGNKSRVVASQLRKQGIEASSINGGLMEWSKLNLPRWRPDVCELHHPYIKGESRP